MLFRRHHSPRIHPVGPPTEQSLVSTSLRTPRTLEEILAASAAHSKSPLQGPRSTAKDSDSSNSSRSGQSVKHHIHSTEKREPRSRKTGYATIHTDATDKHAAFESDAFAVHMPTTRIPIMDRPSPSVRLSAAAQAEAYRTYMEKAREVRERNNSRGVRVPSKIVSYEYTSPKVAAVKEALVKTTHQPRSPPTPAGSFPISPPLHQHGWSESERPHRRLVQGPRAMNESSKSHTPHKLVEPESHTGTPSTQYRYRADSVAGASCSTASPTPPVATTKVRVKPKLTVQEIDRVQTESRYSLYTRPSPTSSTDTSRSSSPSKSMPNFTRRDSLEGDSIFGYKVKDITGTVAGASSTSGSDRDKEKSKSVGKGTRAAPKRSMTSRWHWLRSSTPRVAKSTSSPTAQANAAKSAAYIDPFVTHATPVPTPTFLRSPAASRPASPKKFNRPAPPTSTGNFDSGFAQIKGLTLLLFKIALSLYAVVALWFVLDAVRQAFYTLGAPFRVLKFLGSTGWIWGSWVFKMVVKTWEKWGFRVSLKGGWMWKGR